MCCVHLLKYTVLFYYIKRDEVCNNFCQKQAQIFINFNKEEVNTFS